MFDSNYKNYCWCAFFTFMKFYLTVDKLCHCSGVAYFGRILILLDFLINNKNLMCFRLKKKKTLSLQLLFCLSLSHSLICSFALSIWIQGVFIIFPILWVSHSSVCSFFSESTERLLSWIYDLVNHDILPICFFGHLAMLLSISFHQLYNFIGSEKKTWRWEGFPSKVQTGLICGEKIKCPW